MILGVQISKKKGCETELKDPFSGGVWKIKTGGAFSSRNGVPTLDVRDLQSFSDALKVGLLVFLELWLGTYPLS